MKNVNNGDSDILSDSFVREFLEITKIEELDLSKRAYNCLKRNNISLVSEVVCLSDGDLRAIQHMGRKAFIDIKMKLSKFMLDHHIPASCSSKDIMTNQMERKHTRSITIYISPELKETIEKMIFSNDETMPTDQFVDEEFAVIQSCLATVSTIGLELCSEAYYHPEKVNNLCNSLHEFVLDKKRANEQFTLLKNEFGKICESNRSGSLYSYLHSYTKYKNFLALYFAFFEGCRYIYEIENKIRELSFYKEQDVLRIIGFFKWLQIEFDTIMLSMLSDMNVTGRDLEIIKGRAKKKSLEEITKDIYVSRERVRQLENNINKRFQIYDEKKRILWHVSAKLNGSVLISAKDLQEVLNEKAEMLLYFLSRAEASYYSFNKELKLFSLCSEDDLASVKDYINEMPALFLNDDVHQYIEKITENSNIAEEDILKVIMSKYRVQGQFYVRENIKMSLVDMYNIVLRQYYPQGFKIYDGIEMNQFKENIYSLFGNVKLPKNNHAIEVRIFNHAVLCDRGTYIHSDYIQMPEKLIKEIDSYIECSERIAFSYMELFGVFKSELLLHTNINNYFFLQGVLKYYLIDKYFFTRSNVSKYNDINLGKEFESFILSKGEVSFGELKAEFPGITPTLLQQTLTRSNEVIIYDASYHSVNQLDIADEDYDIRKYLNEATKIRPVTSRKALSDMHIQYPEFLSRNSINSNSKLFSVLKHMFWDEFRFFRPYIGKIGTQDIRGIAVLKHYIKNLPVIKISGIMEFCIQNQIKLIGWASMIRQLEDEYIRIDNDELLHIQELDIEDEKLTSIKDIALEDISKKGYLSAGKVESFLSYPDIGVKWTGFLLKSIVQRFFDEVTIVEILTTDTFYLGSIFVSNDIECEDYEDFIKWVVKSKHLQSPFSSIREIRRWLMEEGLINVSLPKFLEEDGYVYKNEYGEVCVQQ